MIISKIDIKGNIRFTIFQLLLYFTFIPSLLSLSSISAQTALKFQTNVETQGPGTYTYTVPKDTRMTFEVWGGGGRGGGKNSGTGGAGGGGGAKRTTLLSGSYNGGNGGGGRVRILNMCRSYWYKADMANDVLPANGAALSTWKDKTENANHGVSPSSASGGYTASTAHPKWYDNKINFNPAVEFTSGYYMADRRSVQNDMALLPIAKGKSCVDSPLLILLSLIWIRIVGRCYQLILTIKIDCLFRTSPPYLAL